MYMHITLLTDVSLLLFWKNTGVPKPGIVYFLCLKFICFTVFEDGCIKNN